MNTKSTALIFVGFQNDYFAKDGTLRSFIEDSCRVESVLARTAWLAMKLATTDVLMVSTPIIFTDDYRELVDPVGILQAVKEAGAFCSGTDGAETVDEFKQLGDRITELPGKRGLNAFSNTELATTLENRGIEHVVLAGAVTSICIDSTGRSAHERGFRVTILDDCTCGRTTVEQNFFCEQIFPLYANVSTAGQLIEDLGVSTE